MKFFECGLILVLAVASSVHTQAADNYLMSAYEEALELIDEYNYEVNWYRDALTRETYDMGYYFTAAMAEAARVANTDYQGEGLQHCAEVAAIACENNVHWFEDQLRDLEKDTRELHLSVFKVLGETNIKQEGAYMLYYDHSLYMDEMYVRLAEHDLRLWYAYIELFFMFFDVDDELEYCIDAVILPRK